MDCLDIFIMLNSTRIYHDLQKAGVTGLLHLYDAGLNGIFLYAGLLREKAAGIAFVPFW